MAPMKSPERVFRRLCAFGAGFCMAAMFAIIFVNSLRRYTIGKSFEWGEELPIYLGIYGMMFGAAYAYMQDRHIRFTVLVELVPEGARRMVFAAVDLLVAATGALLAYSGYLFAIRRGGVEASGLIGNLRSAAQSTGQQWLEVFGHMAFWQAAMVLGGVLIAAAGIFKFFERIGVSAAEEGR
jgi:TRAP-type C4-dicarboxylate transport system permease small subunit